jgi:hypothetical protein
MRRSTDWYRQQSALAERKYQAIVWGRAAPQSSRQSAAERIFPHLSNGRAVEIPRLGGRSVPDSVASRIFPHLPREGSK